MRIAILDLGTNTFHLLVTAVSKAGEWKKVFKSKIVVKLGEGAIDRNVIAPKPFKRGLRALKHYREIIDEHKPDHVFAFATSAIRSSVNGNDFVAAAKSEAGIDITVISGPKEAELIYKGVKQCVDLSGHCSLIMDIGGGSTEFIIGSEQEIFWKQSYNIGAARLLELFKPSDPITEEEIKKITDFLEEELKELFLAVKQFQPTQLVGSSGSFDTFAEMIGYQFHNRNVIKDVNSYEFNIDEYFQLHERILFSTTMQRNKMKGLIKMRVDMIVLSSICTSFVLQKTGIMKMKLSKYALKEGALAEVIAKLH